MKFNMIHQEGRLLAAVTIDGITHTDDVTDFFEESDVFAEWLSYKQQQISTNEKQLRDSRTEEPFTVHDKEPIYSSIGEYNAEMKNKIDDCYYEVHGVSPPMHKALSIAMNLPRNIHSLAKEWGWSDTEVGDHVYRFIESLNEK